MVPGCVPGRQRKAGPREVGGGSEVESPGVSRKQPWRASHPALDPGWTNPKQGHLGGAGYIWVLLQCPVPHSLSNSISIQGGGLEDILEELGGQN